MAHARAAAGFKTLIKCVKTHDAAIKKTVSNEGLQKTVLTWLEQHSRSAAGHATSLTQHTAALALARGRVRLSESLGVPEMHGWPAARQLPGAKTPRRWQRYS